jgi:hypothetical protein
VTLYLFKICTNHFIAALPAALGLCMTHNGKALLSGLALAAVQFSKDKQMRCYSSDQW